MPRLRRKYNGDIEAKLFFRRLMESRVWLTIVVALVLGWSLDIIRHEDMARENVTLHANEELLAKGVCSFEPAFSENWVVAQFRCKMRTQRAQVT